MWYHCCGMWRAPALTRRHQGSFPPPMWSEFLPEPTLFHEDSALLLGLFPTSYHPLLGAISFAEVS